MAFELPDLPYAHDALADLGMSQETLEFHHDLHHKAYVDKGNELIAGTEWDGEILEEIVKGTIPQARWLKMVFLTMQVSIGITCNFGK